MAELLVKVGDGSGYLDGDILCAFNSRRILQAHTEMICNVRRSGFTKQGLRASKSLPDVMQGSLYQYLFQRVSKNEIERIDSTTGDRQVFSDVSVVVDGKKQRIVADEFLRRRLRSKAHRIFGREGSEYWYGGRYSPTMEKLNAIWDVIEKRTTFSRSQEFIQLWPMGHLDIRHHLAVRVSDFSDSEADELVSPVMDKDALVKKRTHNIDWRAQLLDGISETVKNVVDPEYAIGRDIWIKMNQYRHESKPQPVWDAVGELAISIGA